MAGHIPLKDDLVLTRGADFVARYDIATSDPDIPTGTTATIEITETSDTDAVVVATWTADLVASRYVAFRVESDLIDSIESGWRYRLLVSIPDTPTLEHCWYYGAIKRQQ
ncbi:hypothetical protein [Gordonia sp. SND2]|uniref:LtfC-like domain-containing protein n=1 Tax=Gordonia sp. SND2 TaxID=3388659 RepID=UPI00398A83ED